MLRARVPFRPPCLPHPQPKEPSGKEVKDAQYLKVMQEPHSKITHIMGYNPNWDRNKDREAPQVRVSKVKVG